MKDNFKDVLDSLPKVNPKGEAVTIVGAVKTVSPADIIRATRLGLREIGENKVQEFLQKESEYPPCKLHFIGHLQTNKVKYIIGKVALIQSCDSEKLAEKISALACASGLKQDILLEINIGKEERKSGIMPESFFDVFSYARSLPGVNVRGLMTVLPKAGTDGATNEQIRDYCLQMRGMYDKIKMNDERINILSMGMSADYKIAVECGSNMLRIGSLLFGERKYDTGAISDV